MDVLKIIRTVYYNSSCAGLSPEGVRKWSLHIVYLQPWVHMATISWVNRRGGRRRWAYYVPLKVNREGFVILCLGNKLITQCCAQNICARSPCSLVE